MISLGESESGELFFSSFVWFLGTGFWFLRTNEFIDHLTERNNTPFLSLQLEGGDITMSLCMSGPVRKSLIL